MARLYGIAPFWQNRFVSQGVNLLNEQIHRRLFTTLLNHLHTTVHPKDRSREKSMNYGRIASISRNVELNNPFSKSLIIFITIHVQVNGNWWKNLISMNIAQHYITLMANAAIFLSRIIGIFCGFMIIILQAEHVTGHGGLKWYPATCTELLSGVN